MGNCTASGLVNGEEDAVDLCRERKRLLRTAVDRRHVLADAHFNYVLSLRSVAAAINLFIACHGSSNQTSPLLLQHTPTQPETQSLPPIAASSSSSSSISMTSTSSTTSTKSCSTNVEEIRCGYFYSGLPTMPVSPINEFGWDFFNPFDGVPTVEEEAMLANLCRSSGEDLWLVREEEGIPELEKSEEKVIENSGERKTDLCNGREIRLEEVGEQGERGLTVAERMEKERELLDALRDVEDQFIRAFDCGKEVSKMLEVNNNVNKVDDHLQSFHLDEVKENSSKLIKAITWHRSSSSQSSFRRSYTASSLTDTSSIESKSGVFEDYGGMESGSHSQTLGRLYAWEKKLYQEVKAADHTRQMYEKKCIELKNKQDAKGADSCSLDKIRAAAGDSYTRIGVALRSIETISIRIQKVRDDELQPQLIELLQGLLKTWKIMLESHETQKQIMMEVKSFSCPSYGKFCTDTLRQVTVRLEAELRNWRTCFISYVAAQRSYIEALNGWLSKFFIPDLEYYSPYKSSTPSYNRLEAPPLLIICQDWSNSIKRLPDKSVSFAMKGFIKATRVLWVKQGDEQQQKRKVDSFAKELDLKILAFKKIENKVLESKLCDLKPEPDMRDRVEYLAQRKELIEVFRRKLDIEKVKHQECMKETQRITLDGFRIGLTAVFDSLTEFSKDCLKLYNELLVHNEKEKENGMGGKPSCMEGSQVEVDNRERIYG